MKNVAFHNLGCKVNSYEMEVMQQMLQEKGYNIVPFDEEADIYIINTCTVTNIADRKSRQMLHRAKQKNPNAVVVAVGCYVQTGREDIEKDTAIDLAVGNNRKKDLPVILEKYLKEREEELKADNLSISEKEAEARADNLSISKKEAEARADSSSISEKEAKARADNLSISEREVEARADSSSISKKEVYVQENNGQVIDNSTKELYQRKETSFTNNNKERERKTLSNTTIIDINNTYDYEEMTLKQTAEHTRAYIKIQDGCNQFCSYCVIPYARGRVRSRKAEDIEAEIRGLVEKGYQEIVLTGIHISSYGIDFDNESWLQGKSVEVYRGEERLDYSGSSKLIDLVERIHKIEGLRRIRLGSLEPRIVTENAAKRLGALPKVCPHFHLSLQSGCNATLQRMNRHYTTGEYCQSVEFLRNVFKHVAITTDIIVGFPGETEEEFKQTTEFIQKIKFYEMHIFKYSKRAKTRAAVMPNQVSDSIKTIRSNELLILEKTLSKEFRSYYIGKKVEVLFEEVKEIDGKNYWVGHTADYIKIAVPVTAETEKFESVQVIDFLTDEILYGNRVGFSPLPC